MRLKIFLFILLISAKAFSIESPTTSIEWFKPEVGDSISPGKSQIVLSGRATPGTEIRLTNEQVLLIDANGEIQSMPLKEAFPKEVATADARGLFDVVLSLPFKTAQLPFEVKTPAGETKVYQINVVVQKNKVQIANAKAANISPYAQRKWSVWGGLGFNYLKYDQDSNIPSNLTFQSTDMPALFAKVSRSLQKHWVVQGTFNYAPGKTSSSEQIRLIEGSYQWMFLSANATYLNPNWKSTIKKVPTQFGIQSGLQYHLVPFVKRTSTTDPQAVSVVTNEVAMLTLGGIYTGQVNRYWSFETFLRYQLPVSSGAVFKISPQFAFDGSVGAVYKYSPQWRTGVFWYGQYQKYLFNDHEDTYSQANAGSKISGTQTLFFSNIEARLGYEFD